MQYRKFGKLDWKASALGFGAMRFPVIGGDSAMIDEPEATRMLHYAIEHGVNYVDTAIHYHRGNSELFLGQALKGSYREKVKLTTKLFPLYVEGRQDFDRLLNEQLKKLQTDHVDFYLLHGINRNWWPKLRDLDVLEWAERAVADGRVGHLGFSFHDEYKVFQEIVDAYDKWAMCQIQYNFVDGDYQAGNKGLKYASIQGLSCCNHGASAGRDTGQSATAGQGHVGYRLNNTPAGCLGISVAMEPARGISCPQRDENNGAC